MTADDTPLFTTTKLAKRWGTNDSKVRSLIHAGQLEALDMSMNPGTGRPRWRISPDEVERFERRRSSSANRTPPATTTRPRSTAKVVDFV